MSAQLLLDKSKDWAFAYCGRYVKLATVAITSKRLVEVQFRDLGVGPEPSLI